MVSIFFPWCKNIGKQNDRLYDQQYEDELICKTCELTLKFERFSYIQVEEIDHQSGIITFFRKLKLDFFAVLSTTR